MNNNPLISFCCVSYNHERFISKCIESIWGQDYKNIEIIVVDDGSSDNSANILKNLKSKSPFPMKIIIQDNTGNIGKNFNRALKHANGDYIAMISCDDYFYEDMASSQIKILKQDKNIIFVACSQITGVNEDGISNDRLLSPSIISSLINPNIDDLLDLEFKLESAFYLQGSTLRKDAIEKVGGFDEDMLGDDIILRTKIFLLIKSNSKYSFKILNKPLCYYRIHGSNIHKNSARQMKIVSEYLEKYWPEKKPPKKFDQWLRYSIKNNSFKEIIKIFNYNKTLRNSFFQRKTLICIIKKILKITKDMIYIF